MLISEFLFLLIMLYIGSRFGGIGLGVVSGIGLFIEVLFFVCLLDRRQSMLC